MSKFRETVQTDWRVNEGNGRLFLVVLMYRIANVASRARKRHKIHSVWSVPILLVYRFLTEWLFSYEIPAATCIGKGLMLDHGYGVVINKHSIVGDFVRIKHNVTIGCKTLEDGGQGPSPRIGSYVDIGAGAIVIGGIDIGDRVRIGAGSVVVKNVPSGADVAGNPAKIIRIRE